MAVEARRLGLAADATWRDIGQARAEQMRISRAQNLNLEEGSSWGQIFEYLDGKERQNVAVALGINPNATWRNITATILGLSTIASDEEMIEKISLLRRHATPVEEAKGDIMQD